jgi:hypothetical protein
MKHPNVLNSLANRTTIEKKQELSREANYSTKNSIVYHPLPILKGTGQGHAYHLVDSSP